MYTYGSYLVVVMQRDPSAALFTVRVPHRVGDALIAAQAKTGLKWRRIAQKAIIACADDPDFIAQLMAAEMEKAA